MEYRYAGRLSNIRASEIRELLKLTERPEVISFAGGLPASEIGSAAGRERVSSSV